MKHRGSNLRHPAEVLLVLALACGGDDGGEMTPTSATTAETGDGGTSTTSADETNGDGDATSDDGTGGDGTTGDGDGDGDGSSGDGDGTSGDGTTGDGTTGDGTTGDGDGTTGDGDGTTGDGDGDAQPEPDPDRWTKVWGTSFDSERVSDVGIASTGFPYVAGNYGTYQNFIKLYSDDGAAQWQVTFGQDVPSDDVNSLVVLPADDLLLGGMRYNTTNFRGYLRKTDSAGGNTWEQLWNGGVHTSTNAIAVASGGEILVAGSTEGSLQGNAYVAKRDVFVSQYTAAGVLEWTTMWGTTENDQADGVAITTTGTIYVTGHVREALPGQTFAGLSDIFLARLDGAGNVLQTEQWGSASLDEGMALMADGAGGAYMLSDGDGPLDGGTPVGGRDLSLIKLDDTGTHVWSTQWGTTEDDDGRGLALDASGNILVTGETEGDLGGTNAGGEDVFLSSVSPAGVVLESAQWGSGADDRGYAVAVDLSGGIYVAGSAGDTFNGKPTQGVDAFLMKVAPDASFPTP
jgi:hypothetical protein